MEAVAEGVWRISVLGPNLVNVYLVNDVLIDAGARWSGGTILKQLGRHTLSMVALTHVHPDHQGAAKMLCQKFDIPSPATPTTSRSWRAASRCRGRPCWRAFPTLSSAAHRTRWLMSLRKAIWWPASGCCTPPAIPPVNVGYFRDSDRVAIIGDEMTGISLYTALPGLHQPLPAFTPDPAQNRRSIRKLADLHPSLLCFGHGPVLRDPGKLEHFLSSLPRD